MGNKKVLYFTDCFGEKEAVTISVGTYDSGANLAVQMICAEGEEKGEPYSDVTSNIIPLPPYYAAIVTYSGNENIRPFLIENNLGRFTPRTLYSGYAKFPVFQFDTDRLRELDPDGCAEFEKVRAAYDAKQEMLPHFAIVCENINAEVWETHARTEHAALEEYRRAHYDPMIHGSIQKTYDGLRVVNSVGGRYKAVVKNPKSDSNNGCKQE